MSVPGVASRAADRFYCPPPRRHLLDKQQKQHQPLTAAPAVVEEPAKPTQELRRHGPPTPPAPAATNLESFIASTAVRVPARRHPRTGARGRGPGAGGHGEAPYYVLADLWDAFGEWSAYGAGVPLLLNGTDGVVQYYVPFLSAIQLYGSRPPPSSDRARRTPAACHLAARTSSAGTPRPLLTLRPCVGGWWVGGWQSHRSFERVLPAEPRGSDEDTIVLLVVEIADDDLP